MRKFSRVLNSLYREDLVSDSLRVPLHESLLFALLDYGACRVSARALFTPRPSFVRVCFMPMHGRTHNARFFTFCDDVACHVFLFAQHNLDQPRLDVFVDT